MTRMAAAEDRRAAMFDAAQALYWFAANYHEGQWSDLYRVLSLSPYRPGMAECAPEPDTIAEDLYVALTGWGDIERERLRENKS